MHVKLANGSVEQFPYTLGQLRRDNPNVSFPRQVADSILAEYDVYPVSALEKPDYDPLVQSLSRGQPSSDNGSWKVSYTVQNMLQSEAEANVRSERDSLLQETDWWAVSDRTMTAEQTAYRQSLRDITSQAGFPFSVTWPVKV